MHFFHPLTCFLGCQRFFSPSLIQLTLGINTKNNLCSVTALCHKVSPPFREKTGFRFRDVNITQTLLKTRGGKKTKKNRRNMKNKNKTFVGVLGQLVNLKMQGSFNGDDPYSQRAKSSRNKKPSCVDLLVPPGQRCRVQEQLRPLDWLGLRRPAGLGCS